MDKGEPKFTLEQALSVQRALRDMLNLPDELFPVPAFIGMISDEIELMRQAGKTDQDIAVVIADKTGVVLNAGDIVSYYAPPEDRHRQ